MKKSFLIFNILTAGIFALFVILNLFISNGEYSYLENRYLQKAPEFSITSVAERKFMNEAESYCDDQLFLRDFFVKTKSAIERISGKKESKGVYFAKDGYLIEKTAEYDEEKIEKNISSVAEIRDSGKYNVSFCVIPQAFESLKEMLPKGVYKDDVKKLEGKLESEFGDSVYINLSSVLESNKEAYYRTDHHLTAKGNYFLYSALGEKLGYTPLPEDAFEKTVADENFTGTTYSKALTAKMPDKIEKYSTEVTENATVEFIGEDKKSDSLFFTEHLDKKDKYSYFLDGNHGLTVVAGNAETGKSIALFKDSYAHALTPLLINHYDKIHLIDMRYYREDPIEYIAKNHIKDILFLYGSSTFMTDETVSSVAEYAKNSPYANIGKIPESEAVEDSWFSDAVFIGDSLTMGLEAFSGMTAGEFLCDTGLSIDGVYTNGKGTKSIFARTVEKNPSKIYILLGANEHLVPKNKENVLKRYSNLVDKLKEKLPEAEIFIQAIFPYSEKKEARGKIKNETIASYNEALLEMAEEKFIYFLSPSEAVTDEKGYLKSDLTYDGLHLNNKGCGIWADYLRSHTAGKDTSVAAAGKIVEFTEGKYQLEKISEEIEKSAVFGIPPEETTPHVLVKTHKLPYEKIKNAYGMAGAGTTAEEISLFELNSEEDGEEIEKLLKEYVEERIRSFDSYLPSETPKLKSAVIIRNKTFVALVVAKDVKNTEEILKRQ